MFLNYFLLFLCIVFNASANVTLFCVLLKLCTNYFEDTSQNLRSCYSYS